MAPDTEYAALAADLVALGHALPSMPSMPSTTSTEALTAAVMARLSDPPPVTEQSLRRLLRRAVDAVAGRRRRAIVAVTCLLLALLAAPPVRAAVGDWFGFAGVVVRQGPSPGPSSAPPPPSVGPTMTLDDAARSVDFEAVVPTALGTPREVGVSGDRRVLSMSWTDEAGGPAVRLDQFDGRLDYTFAKTAPSVEFTTVAGEFAMWFDEPHEVVVLGTDGSRRTETARLAGNTLIWEHGGTALRLEGDLSLARATQIAESVTALP